MKKIRAEDKYLVLNGPTTGSFQTDNTIFTTKQCEIGVSNNRHRDSNVQPLDCVFPLTTRPELSFIPIFAHVYAAILSSCRP